MGLYTNNSGTLSPIAGRGKAEYGASAIRKGVVDGISCAKDSTTTVAVTFDTPMPDADYIINIDTMTQFSEVVAGTKTANGFTFYIYNNSLNNYTNQSIEYTAFKLYTDNEYNSLMDAMPDDMGSSNKLVATNDLLDLIYPVGSIYLSTSSGSPSIIFGGTWVQIKDTFLLACGDTYSNGATGGQSEVTLATEQIPVHTHPIPSLTGSTTSTGEHNHICGYRFDIGPGGSQTAIVTNSNLIANQTYTTGGHNHNISTNASTTESAGSGNAHDNMPPYLAVYAWKRTA